jgi:hypothetical protein
VARIGEATAGQKRSSLLEASSLSGWLWNPTAQSRRGQTQASSGDGMPRCTVADVMAQGGRWTHGHPHDKGVVMGGRPVVGSLADVATRVSRGGGIWAEERVDRWAPSVIDGGTVMAGRLARTRRWVGVGAEVGRPWRKRPTKVFPF